MPTSLSPLFQLDPEYTFLNHGSFGACPRPVFEVYQEWQRELERRPVEFLARRFPDLMAEARAGLASFLDTDADNLVFVPNATTGINTVAQTLPLNAGDEVLTTNLEYGALDRAWTKACGMRGAAYVRHPVDLPIRSASDFVEGIWSAVTEHTRVLFLSHITSSTAITFPIQELVDRARSRGIITVIDGAHVPGQRDLSLDQLGADFYTGNCHKWMLTPKGSAFLFARPDAQRLIGPLVVSWGDKSRPDSPFIQELEFLGTKDIAAYLSVPAGIEFLRDHDWPNVRRRCHELVRYYREQMTAITGLEPIVPDSEDYYSQMSAHPLPDCDGETLKSRLYDEYKIEIPVTEVGSRRFLRISVQGYNDKADVDRLLGAVRELLADPSILRRVAS